MRLDFRCGVVCVLNWTFCGVGGCRILNITCLISLLWRSLRTVFKILGPCASTEKQHEYHSWWILAKTSTPIHVNSSD